MISLDNYFVLHGLVISTLSAVILFLSWIVTRYLLHSSFSFTKLTYGIAGAVVVVWGAVIVNYYYPFVMIIVPAFLCAAIIHSLIVVFTWYLAQQEYFVQFPTTWALLGNYLFFSLTAFSIVYYNNGPLVIFFYYITEGCIKIGIVILLILILNIKRIATPVQLEKEVVYNPAHSESLMNSFDDHLDSK